MPAISRRRGSAASFGRAVGAAGLPFCSGGNLRTGSANALLLSGFAGRILDRGANVFLDGLELGEQAVGIGGIDAFQRGGGELRAQAGELAEQWACGLLQKEAVDAAIGLVAATLDPVIVAQLV